MKVLEKEHALDALADYVDQVGDETLIITESGRPVAALVSLDDMDYETISLSTNPNFLEIIERSRRRDETEGRLTLEEVRASLKLNLSR